MCYQQSYAVILWIMRIVHVMTMPRLAISCHFDRHCSYTALKSSNSVYKRRSVCRPFRPIIYGLLPMIMMMMMMMNCINRVPYTTGFRLWNWITRTGRQRTRVLTVVVSEENNGLWCRPVYLGTSYPHNILLNAEQSSVKGHLLWLDLPPGTVYHSTSATLQLWTVLKLRWKLLCLA